jgi:hypothetical protein
VSREKRQKDNPEHPTPKFTPKLPTNKPYQEARPIKQSEPPRGNVNLDESGLDPYDESQTQNDYAAESDSEQLQPL